MPCRALYARLSRALSDHARFKNKHTALQYTLLRGQHQQPTTNSEAAASEMCNWCDVRAKEQHP